MDLVTEITVPEGYLLNTLDGSLLRDTPRERLRQSVIENLIANYGFKETDIESEFALRSGRIQQRLDLVIFTSDVPHCIDTIERVVVCRPQAESKRTTRVRGYDQARSDIEALSSVMKALPGCQYGMWTNGFDYFYLEIIPGDYERNTQPIGDWPPHPALGTLRQPQFSFRSTDPEALRTAFRRCHDFIHGNEGMPKDAAFWQFLYLIFCKIYDEQQPSQFRRFWAGPHEQFSQDGRISVRERVIGLFDEVKNTYSAIFRGNEEITISERALAFIVNELGRFELIRTPIDVKGVAYQEIVGANLRGDRGQYFTPRPVIKLVTDMIDPDATERLLDPACGTGGFLVGALDHVLAQLRTSQQASEENEIYNRVRTYAQSHLFGCDFDRFLIRASQMNMLMAGDGSSHIFNLNSLEFPKGQSQDLARAAELIPLESVHIIATNPPFGAGIPISDPDILENFDLAHRWIRGGDGTFLKTQNLQKSVAPEVLFIERCLQWLAPLGRMGIVVPDGILSNPALEYVRQWILRQSWVVACVDLPVEAFIAEAGVSILTSVLILRKRERELDRFDDAEDYPIFMAVAEKVGYDRRGNRQYRRDERGRELLEVREQLIGSRLVRKYEKVIDNDLPSIATEFQTWRQTNATVYPHIWS